MTSKIKVERKKTVVETVEVTFPLYLRDYDYFDAGGGFETFWEIQEDGRYRKITKRNYGDEDKPEWDFVKGRMDFRVELAYLLDTKETVDSNGFWSLRCELEMDLYA